MRYMGSKNKYSKNLVPIIQKYIDENNIENFISCFCGGANLEDKIQCKNVIANDLSPTLIALHKQAQEDFSKIPEHGDREFWDKSYSEWKKINTSKDKQYIPEIPLFKIGAIEWYGSFCNGGFRKGYAKPTLDRNYYLEGYNSHKKQAEQPLYKKIFFQQGDYLDIKFENYCKQKSVLYCDAPYANTTPYGINPNFNFKLYYHFLQAVSCYIPIFVSEQYLPPEFDNYLIWSKEAVRTMNKANNFRACEKLYLIDRR